MPVYLWLTKDKVMVAQRRNQHRVSGLLIILNNQIR